MAKKRPYTKLDRLLEDQDNMREQESADILLEGLTSKPKTIRGSLDVNEHQYTIEVNYTTIAIISAKTRKKAIEIIKETFLQDHNIELTDNELIVDGEAVGCKHENHESSSHGFSCNDCGYYRET